jgi:hypothetical protein
MLKNIAGRPQYHAERRGCAYTQTQRKFDANQYGSTVTIEFQTISGIAVTENTADQALRTGKH